MNEDESNEERIPVKNAFGVRLDELSKDQRKAVSMAEYARFINDQFKEYSRTMHYLVIAGENPNESDEENPGQTVAMGGFHADPDSIVDMLRSMANVAKELGHDPDTIHKNHVHKHEMPFNQIARDARYFNLFCQWYLQLMILSGLHHLFQEETGLTDSQKVEMAAYYTSVGQNGIYTHSPDFDHFFQEIFPAVAAKRLTETAIKDGANPPGDIIRMHNNPEGIAADVLDWFSNLDSP